MLIVSFLFAMENFIRKFTKKEIDKFSSKKLLIHFLQYAGKHRTFRQLALNNVLRNRRVYAAYFLSSLFTVMVFFTFVNFAFHPALTGEGINANVTQGMLVAGGII